MTSPQKGDPVKLSNGQVKPRSVPKRFIFETSAHEETHDSNSSSQEQKNSAFIPVLQEFISPENYEEAYQKLSGCLVEVFNEVREVLMMVQLGMIKANFSDRRVQRRLKR